MIRFLKVVMSHRACRGGPSRFRLRQPRFCDRFIRPLRSTTGQTRRSPSLRRCIAVVIVAAMLGVVAARSRPGCRKGRHRRASRQSRVEADKWRAQAEALKAAQAQTTAPPALPRNR